MLLLLTDSVFHYQEMPRGSDLSGWCYIYQSVSHGSKAMESKLSKE